MRSMIFCALFFFTSVGRAQGVHAVDFANRVWTHTCVGRVRTQRGVSSDWQPAGDDRAFRVDAPSSETSTAMAATRRWSARTAPPAT